ncbi:flagellar hook-length control protein FliK [Denitrificimonas caeni]|uniref:flagellar hook-length control protein FliK n=1 Tax=Denitrificimonas caeni TaxID=521720 RepID=UPI0003B67F55|nr:flagellar hook-length control protein FliK [Denitrificimonas caeni]
MAGTDFLLQLSAGTTRAQTVELQKGSHERASTTAPSQSFSSLYEQQRASTANQQQRRDAVQQDKQQQASRHAAAKNTAAAQQHKDKPVTTSKARAEVKTEQSAKPADNAAGVNNNELPDQSAVVDGKDLPPETVAQDDETDNPLIDPLLLMALTAQPQEIEAEVDVQTLDDQEGDSVSLLLSTEGQDSEVELTADVVTDEIELAQEDVVVVANKDNLDTSKAKGATDSDEVLLVSIGGLKSGELKDEKLSTDKNPLAAAIGSVKAAPDTLLNKAVTPADGVRADLQARPEPSLASQTVRQVPGAAVAMQQPGWSQQVTDKVMWMSSQNLQSAEIKLDPAELGRLDVKITINQEHTQITFNSAHAGVRDSLESQMYRLREMFAQQGMQDVDVNVADQSHAQQDSRERSAGQGRLEDDAENTDDNLQYVSNIREQHDGRLGMVDYYA